MIWIKQSSRKQHRRLWLCLSDEGIEAHVPSQIKRIEPEAMLVQSDAESDVRVKWKEDRLSMTIMRRYLLQHISMHVAQVAQDAVWCYRLNVIGCRDVLLHCIG